MNSEKIFQKDEQDTKARGKKRTSEIKKGRANETGRYGNEKKGAKDKPMELVNMAKDKPLDEF